MARRDRNKTAWAAIAGNWSFRGSSAEYTGSEDPRSPVGVALSSARIRNGHISSKIRLNNPGQNAGRLLLGYNTVTGGYYSVGLGGYGYAYLVDEFVPGQAWRAVKHKGNVSQLDGNTSYQVDVEIRGQRISLAVDGINLIDHTLSYPLTGSQAGLFAWGPGPVQFESFESSGDRPKAFIVMQFTEPYNSLYAEVIEPVCEKLGFEAFRADDVFRPGIILQDIISGLVESDVVIADISPTNANVFYELGYAHALDKPTVLLARREGELPFDISGYRVIFYDDTIRGKPEVEETLQKHLSSILRGASR
jgi:hypothetical protein